MLESGSLAALNVLRGAAQKLPEETGAALAGLLISQVDKRLQLQADRADNPGIADESISQPIIIIGMPRSGTSLLHALMTADPDNRAPTAWELQTPSPPAPDQVEQARRRALSAQAIEAFITATPEILKLHPYWDQAGDAAVECEDIMQISLVSGYFPAFFRLPDYDDWLATADFAPAYRAHHEFLQHLQWHSPRRRWILKGVTHVEHLDLVIDTYPDARLVWPHRDPVEQLASMCMIVAVTRRVNDPDSLNEIYRHLVENTARGLDAALAHPAARDGRIIHVPFARLNREPQAVIADIYGQIGSRVSTEHEEAMAGWLAAPQNDAGRHGRLASDLERFGATTEDVRKRFANYFDSGLVEAAP